MRDWTKLRVFEQADMLVIAIYKDSEQWPPSQRYSLTQQIQRAAVSIASNIVEGCSRTSTKEYVRFLEVAYGSACELQYQLSVARRLEFSDKVAALEVNAQALSKSLGAMLCALTQSPKPKA